MFYNRFNNLVNSSDKKDIISHCQNKNVTSSQLSAIEKNRIAGHSKPEEQTESAKRDKSDVSFFY